MKIDSSTISMSSQTALVQTCTKEESTDSWIGDKQPASETSDKSPVTFNPKQDQLELSDFGKSLLAQYKASTQIEDVSDDSAFELSDKDRQKIEMIQRFIEALTGKKFKFYFPDKTKSKSNAAACTKQIDAQVPAKQGWGYSYDSTQSYKELEKMSFSSQGVVKTSDGREINFSVQVNMSREFISQKEIHIRAGDAAKVDPLVIAFGENTPGLTDKKISFDIDSDGKNEQISTLSQGSGFLALDSNGDGKINNGKELFGPNSGNGFLELAAYDTDKNNWIDENDPIYDKLKIWSKDADGNDKLFALGEKGVGAIYLGNIDTDYNLKNISNDLQGEIKKTGLYLNENGSVGTIQHIDLVV